MGLHMSKRRLLKLLALVVFIVMVSGLVLTGCQGAGGKKGESGKFTFVLAQYSNATEPFARKVIEDFQKENKNIEIDLQVVGWDIIEQKINTMVSTKQAPDLLNFSYFSRFVEDDLLMEVEDVISPELKEKFYDSFYDACKIDGKAYAMPFLASIRSLYYNKAVFEQAGIAEPPKTWSELIEVSKTIKEKTGIDPFGIEMTNFEGQAFFAYFIWGNGGDFKRDGKWVLNSPENIEAVQFMVDLINKEKVTNPQPTAINRDELQKVFGQGKLGMLITANFFPTILKSEAPDCEYGIAPIPVNEGKPPMSLGVQDFIMIFNSTKVPGAIGKFLDFFFEDSRYEEFMNIEGMLPATETAGKIMAEKDETIKQFIDLLPVAKFYPLTDPKYGEMRLEIIKACQEAILGEKTVEQALNDAQKKAEG